MPLDTASKNDSIHSTAEGERNMLIWLQSISEDARQLYNELASHNSKDYNNDDFSSMSEREGGEMGIKNSVGSAIEEELQDIVTALLACCHPNVVPMAYHCLVSYEHIRDKALTVGHFPDHSCSYEYIPLDTPLGKDTWESKVWVQLRLLLSRLAPISSYVAVQVVCTIQRRLAGSTIITSNTETYSVATATQQGILLFSHWLPDIAPHLHPIVEDFFRSIPQHVWDTLSIEIRSNSNSKNNFISLAEGMLDIFQYYTYKRCDGVHLKKWCNWSWIFDLLEHHQNLTKLQLSNHTTNDNDNHRNGNNSNSQTKGNSTADTSLLSFAGIDTTTMDIADVPEVDTICFGFQYCPSWYSARLIATLLELLPPQRLEYFQQLDEAVHGNNSQLNYITKLDIPYWFQTMKLNACDVVTQSLTTTFVPPQPDPIPIVKILSPYSHPYLVSIGPGILQYVCGSLLLRASSFPSTQPQTIAPINSAQSTKPLSLVPTPTTERNLQKLGFALCIDPPPPILVCGPRGSGKSALVRELSQRMCCMEGGMSTCSRSASNLLELHLDDETDSKTLLGSMVATETPGEFVWKPGSLTLAVEQGRWVLMEDVDKAPPELLAALKPLFEDRILPYHATRKRIKAHPNFRFFGTCSMKPSSNKDATRYPRRIPGPNRMLISEIWRKVHVDGLPYQELADIVAHRFPMLPPCITESCLNTFHAFDRVSTHNGQLHSSMITSTNVNELPNDNISNNYAESSLSKSTMVEIIDNFLAESRKITNFINSVIRTVSIRDLMKLCQRIEAGNIFVDHTTTFVPESQRILCLAEAVDVFVSSAACRRTRVACVEKICAPIWKISSSLAVQYVEARKLEWQIKESRITLGRATITTVQGDVTGTINHLSSGICSNFFDTNHSLRLMESISVCIAQNEPILLVGETGVGKTVIIQRLASMSGTHLVVQNMSLQTDSTDLLGGYRPVEIRQSARKMYKTFMEMFVSTFSRNQNTEFLNYVTAAYEKSQWKKLSQCFHRASLMGMNKIKQLEASKSSEKNLDDSKRRIILRKSWNEFHADAERFEKQRIANSSGLSFAFTEGALVDAIKTGKWVFLDEVNLASSETLQRLCGLLDDSTSSITLSERGDVEALHRHPDFRLFAAMNPATDVGKKDLPSSIRARFTEFYVDELVDPAELRAISARYLNGLMLTGSTMLENSEIVVKSVEVYLRCRELSEQVLVDSSGQRPRYTLRTLTRALSAARNFILKLGFSPQRAVLEGFELAFEGPLDEGSRSVIQKLLNSSLGKGLTKKDLDHPGRRPGGKTEANDYILVKPFWVRSGPLSPMDWAVIDGKGKTNFVLTPSASLHLRRLTRVVASVRQLFHCHCIMIS
jgi:MoxR-like ATPase